MQNKWQSMNAQNAANFHRAAISMQPTSAS